MHAVAPLPMLPGAVVVRAPLQEPAPHLLSDAERAWADAHRPRRRVEFLAGRAALRVGLRAVGCEPPDLLPQGQGRTDAPRGFTASLSHKDGEVVAIAAPADGWTVGVDLEVLGVPRCGIASRVLRPAELQRWRDGGEAWDALLTTFSIKEAIYKALHPWVPRYIGFEEAEVEGSVVRMHLKQGEGPFDLRAWHWWEGERLLAIVQARPS